MNTEIVTAFKAMRTDIQISMDDVVSAFVSQYENNLYTRKKGLTSAIRTVEENLGKFTKALHKKINGNSFKTPLPLGLEMKVDDGTINWEQTKVDFQITIEPNTRNGRCYGNNISINKTKPIPAAQVKAHKKLQKELGSLRSDLSEVLVSLKSVTRKERQVRGRIAIRKLEDSGYADLMKDEELVKLVELSD